MKFTFERKTLIKMLQLVGKKIPGHKQSDKTVKLSACSVRGFVESNSTIAGMEALVLQDGTCTLDLKSFLAVSKTYDKAIVVFEAGADGIKFVSTLMNAVSFSPTAEAPCEVPGVSSNRHMGCRKGERLNMGASTQNSYSAQMNSIIRKNLMLNMFLCSLRGGFGKV